jgi:hypothetical protein
MRRRVGEVEEMGVGDPCVSGISCVNGHIETYLNLFGAIICQSSGFELISSTHALSDRFCIGLLEPCSVIKMS